MSQARPAVQPNAGPFLAKLTFAQAIAQGQSRNVSAEVARCDIDRAMGLVQQARAAFLPSLNGQAGLAHLNAARKLGGNLLAGQNQRTAALNLSVPLVAPRAWGDWTESHTAHAVAIASAANVRRAVAIGVARSYLEIVTQKHMVAVHQSAMDTDRAHYDYAKARFDGGVGTCLDRLRADQELGNSEVLYQNALVALDQAQQALGLLLGSAEPVDAVDLTPLLATGTQTEALQTAQTLRADVRLAQGQLAQAAQVRQHTWLDFAPTLLATGTLFTSYPATPSMPLNGWELQLLLQVPLYDGGARYGAMTGRDAAQSQADVRLAEVRRQARSEIRLAYDTAAHAEAALKAAQRSAASAHQALQLANTAYHVGTTGNLEVIDAARVNRDAQTAAVVAADTVRQVRLDMLTAAGRFP